MEALGFRVAAPKTMQGAPLEKNRRPQSGTVFGRHTLNIVYHA